MSKTNFPITQRNALRRFPCPGASRRIYLLLLVHISTSSPSSPLWALLTVTLMCIFYPETTDGSFEPASSIRKLSKAHSTNRRPRMYLLHCPALFYKQSTEGTHSGFPPKAARSLFNLPYFMTVSAPFSVLSAGFS